jgi:hypothetical protein
MWYTVYGFPSFGVETEVVGMEICKAGDIIGNLKGVFGALVRDGEGNEDARSKLQGCRYARV